MTTNEYEKLPLCDVRWSDKSAVEIQGTATGWYYRTGSGLKGIVYGCGDGIICRVNPGADREVVQLGIGKTTSSLCNAVFSSRIDEALVFESDGLKLEYDDCGEITLSCDGPLTVTVIEKYMKVHRGQPRFSPLDRSVFKRPPTGWCTWYYYYLDIDQEELVKNTDWLADNMKKYG